MSPPPDACTEYLENLRDLLPHRDAARVLSEVEGLLLDRIDAEVQAGATPGEAESRAIAALGPPERLAEDVVAAPLRVDLATRRAFGRMLAVLFAVHLLLAIVLTVAGREGVGIPGLLAPLPTRPLVAVFSAVLSVFLLDVGALFLVFALLGRGKPPALLPQLRLREAVHPRDAVLALVLLGLIALILHPFRDQIFAVRRYGHLQGFLGAGIVEVLPFLDAVLALFAIRQGITLLVRREHPAAVAADAVASAGLAALLVVLSTRDELVQFPSDVLGREGAALLANLVTRAFLMLFLFAALLLAVRFVKRLLRLRQLLAAR
jgi:hypothetical protein